MPARTPRPPRNWADGHTHSTKPLNELSERAFCQDCEECLAYIGMLEALVLHEQQRIEQLDGNPVRLVHFLRSDHYYACIRAVGSEVKGLATRNWKLVTCRNCLKVKHRYEATP